MIDSIRQQTGSSVRRICAVLELPRSSYHHAASPTRGERADEALGAIVELIFREHRGRYGYRRIWREMRDRGHPCAPDRVRRS